MIIIKDNQARIFLKKTIQIGLLLFLVTQIYLYQPKMSCAITELRNGRQPAIAAKITLFAQLLLLLLVKVFNSIRLIYFLIKTS